ncbi:transcription elongation factor NusA [archaeon]|nr:MAG: transcription elongation factor NusA [archaeon]
MKSPICDICLKSGILCPGCQEKVIKGEISELEVEISLKLYNLLQKYKMPQELTFHKAIETDDTVVLVVGENQIGTIVGKGGKVVKSLQKDLEKKIRVIENTDDIKKIAQDLIHPARIAGINILYLPGGGTKKKLRIPVEDEKKLPIDTSIVEDIILRMAGESVDVVIE